MGILKNWIQNFIKKKIGQEAPPEEPLNELERLFLKAVDDPSAREAFYLALLHSELYVSGSFRGPGEAELQFFDVAGEKVLPVFSDKSRLEKVLGAQAPQLTFKGADLIGQVAPGRDMALNPYSGIGREFNAAELKDLLSRL